MLVDCWHQCVSGSNTCNNSNPERSGTGFDSSRSNGGSRHRSTHSDVLSQLVTPPAHANSRSHDFEVSWHKQQQLYQGGAHTLIT